MRSMMVRSIVDRWFAWQWASALRAVFISFALCFVLVSPALAAIQQIRVIGVGMDTSPQLANKKALEYARKRAVFLVLTKMNIEGAAEKVATLKDAQLDRIIRGSTVSKTKFDDATYTGYAEVTVSVIDTVLMKELGIEEVATLSEVTGPVRARGVMLLPIYVIHDRPYVWETQNTLRLKVQAEALKISHGAVVVPTGDFEDLRLIDFRNVLTVKSDELKPMFDRYGVEEIILAIVPEEPLRTDEEATILLRRLNQKEILNETIVIPAPPNPETLENRLLQVEKVLANTAYEIALSSSKQQREALMKSEKISISFYFASVREIGQMQKAIRSSDGVLYLEVPSISLSGMQGTLYYTGDKEDLRQDLRKKGLFVRDIPTGWKVSVR